MIFAPLPTLFEELSAVLSGLGNWYQYYQGVKGGIRDHFTGVEGALEGGGKELFGEGI